SRRPKVAADQGGFSRYGPAPVALVQVWHLRPAQRGPGVKSLLRRPSAGIGAIARHWNLSAGAGRIVGGSAPRPGAGVPARGRTIGGAVGGTLAAGSLCCNRGTGGQYL